MNGKTLRISSAHYSQAVLLDDNTVMLARVDGGPHRICRDMEHAKQVAEWVGDALPWAESNPGKSDDSWSNMISIKGDKLAEFKERSRVTYDLPEENQKAADAKVAASLEADKENAKAKAAADVEARAETRKAEAEASKAEAEAATAQAEARVAAANAAAAETNARTAAADSGP